MPGGLERASRPWCSFRPARVSSGVTAAVIAAVVSVAVAAASVIITFVTTRASLRRDHERQAAEFGRAMTARLCDRRVAVHPGLFQITGAFRNTRLAGAASLDGHLTQAWPWSANGTVPKVASSCPR